MNLPEEQRLVEAAYYRGQLMLKNRDWKVALTDFQRVIIARPDFTPAIRLSAEVELMQGNLESGLRQLDTLLLLRPSIESESTPESGTQSSTVEQRLERGRLRKRSYLWIQDGNVTLDRAHT